MPDRTTLVALYRAWRLVHAAPDALTLAGPTGADEALADWLHRTWWCGVDCDVDCRVDPDGRPPATRPVEGLAAQLDAVVRPTRLSPDWLVIGVDRGTDRLVVSRTVDDATQTLSVPAAAIVVPPARRREAKPHRASAGHPPGARAGVRDAVREGARVWLLTGRTTVDGHQWRYGQGRFTGEADLLLLDLDATAAVEVVASLASELGRAAVPHVVSCPLTHDGFERRDVVAVRLPRTARDLLAPLLAQWAVQAAPATRGRTAPLTRALAPGIAWAEDPGGSRDFGRLRCLAVARAVRQAHGAQAVLGRAGDGPAVERALVEGLRRCGVDPSAPERVGPCEPDVRVA